MALPWSKPSISRGLLVTNFACCAATSGPFLLICHQIHQRKTSQGLMYASLQIASCPLIKKFWMHSRFARKSPPHYPRSSLNCGRKHVASPSATMPFCLTRPCWIAISWSQLVATSMTGCTPWLPKGWSKGPFGCSFPSWTCGTSWINFSSCGLCQKLWPKQGTCMICSRPRGTNFTRKIPSSNAQHQRPLASPPCWHAW